MTQFTINPNEQPAGTIYWGFRHSLDPFSKDINFTIGQYMLTDVYIIHSPSHTHGGKKADLLNPSFIVDEFKKDPVINHKGPWQLSYCNFVLARIGVKGKPLKSHSMTFGGDCYIDSAVKFKSRVPALCIFETEELAAEAYDELLNKQIKYCLNDIEGINAKIKALKELVINKPTT